MMKVRIFYFLALTLLFSCKKVKNNPVPSIPFDITINLSLPSYSDLQGVGGWCYVNGGSRGIIVYRRSYEEFVAFDRHSPAQLTDECTDPLVPDANNFLQLNDACTGAVFSLYDGSPVSGAEIGLRQYQTMWDGGFNLRVFN